MVLGLWINNNQKSGKSAGKTSRSLKKKNPLRIIYMLLLRFYSFNFKYTLTLLPHNTNCSESCNYIFLLLLIIGLQELLLVMSQSLLIAVLQSKMPPDLCLCSLRKRQCRQYLSTAKCQFLGRGSKQQNTQQKYITNKSESCPEGSALK